MTLDLNAPLILIIDDDYYIRMHLKMFLEDKGFRVRTAGGGEDGLDLLKILEPDVVLLDLMMPLISGFDILEFVREQKFTFPVIILSAVDEVADAIRAIKLGAYDFIPKPISALEEVSNCINNALDGLRLKNELQAYQKRLEELVAERTIELNNKAAELERTNWKLQQEIDRRTEIEKDSKTAKAGIWDTIDFSLKHLSQDLHETLEQGFAEVRQDLREVINQQEARSAEERIKQAMHALEVIDSKLSVLSRCICGMDAHTEDFIKLLEEYLEQIARTSGISMTRQLSISAETQIPAYVKASLYRLIQEIVAYFLDLAGTTELGIICLETSGQMVWSFVQSGTGPYEIPTLQQARQNIDQRIHALMGKSTWMQNQAQGIILSFSMQAQFDKGSSKSLPGQQA